MIVSNTTEVLLTMNISGREFAKAKLMQYLNAPGYTATWISDDSCVFNSWCFTGTEEREGIIYMTGPSFTGVTLLTILTDPVYKDRRVNVFEKLRSAIEQSIESNITLPLSGPCATLVAEDGTLLFLPQEYIQRSVSFLHETDASSLYGCYHRPGLNHTDSLRFMLSVYAYQIITGRLPYPKKNEEERIDDYTDKNFIPVKYWNPHVSTEFSDLLSHNFSVAAEIKRTNKKNKKQVQEEPTEIKSKSLPSLESAIHETKALDYSENEQLSAQNRYKFTTAHLKKIRFKRFFRNKGTLLKIIAAICAVVIIIIGSLINDSKNKPTTIGLSPYEVVELFYTSLNTLDVVLTSSTTKKSMDDGYKNMISNFYVMNKVRTAYDTSSQTLHPGQWLLINGNFAHWMFGVTQLQIDSIHADIYAKHHKIKRQPLQENKGAKESMSVSFYLVRHEGSEELVVTTCNDIVELEFYKNRWIIVNITSDDKVEVFNANDFNSEYAELDSSLNVYEKANFLSKKYYWIPTDIEIKKSLEELQALYDQYTF